MMYRKVLFLSLILFLLMGFACAENPVDADSGFNVSNLIKDYTFGFSAFKNNVLFLRKNVLSEPKRKKS